jgi:hypothetical protein
MTLEFSRVTLPPLWTVDQAKVHLRITGTAHDADIAQKLATAQEAILAYLNDAADPSWDTGSATAADLERVAVGTVISSASHLVRGDWHPGVTTESRMLFDGQTFAITGVVNVELRGIEMICGAVQVVT